MPANRARPTSLFHLILALLGAAIPSLAMAAPEFAIGGYDPLTYLDHESEGPALGDPMYTFEHGGAEFRFVSSDNMAAFSMSPDAYAPTFGALDPVELASGKRAPGDPEIFSVIDDRVYLFTTAHTRDLWLRQLDTLAPRAIANLASADAGSDLEAAATRNTSKYQTKKDLGANGYDVVAYFPEGGGTPTKGSKQHATEYRGVTYRFASAANMERFKQHPSHYEPAYGGWCAYAIAKEDYTKPNPKRFLIQNDRLLLFYDGFLGDTYKSWKKEGPQQLEHDADRWWLEEIGENP